MIRFALDINPITAQVEVCGAQSEAIPHIIKGIVVHVREIRVYMDRAKFIINPTNCSPLSHHRHDRRRRREPRQPRRPGAGDGQHPVRGRGLLEPHFKPGFTVSTVRQNEQSADGASLTAKLTVPAALGTQANIKEVKVDLPKQLPSRLTTLQKACTAAQFNTNPAGCPAASNIGYAKAITPILPVPLEGPVYFVSHGGEAFPSLEIVLQGYGVTIDLVATTFISKAGITSSTFHTVPDQPVTSFEITLPEGKSSALAANGNLCAPTKTVTVKKKVNVKVHGQDRRSRGRSSRVAESLAMPTAFVAQNGAEIHQSPPPSASRVARRRRPAKKKATKIVNTNAKGKKKHTKKGRMSRAAHMRI